MKPMFSSTELLRMHIEAMFVRGAEGDLLAINEPWGAAQPAPKLYVGWAEGGQWMWSFGAHVGDCDRERLTDCLMSLQEADAEPHACALALQPIAMSARIFEEICCRVPEGQRNRGSCVLVTKESIDGLALGEFAWLRDEIATARPCAALVREGHVASVCRSVRISHRAHEAGIETAAAWRGHGFAGEVLGAWASAVRQAECVPLYSMSCDNAASRRTAEKAGLPIFARGLSVY